MPSCGPLASDDRTRRALSQLLRGRVGREQVCILGRYYNDSLTQLLARVFLHSVHIAQLYNHKHTCNLQKAAWTRSHLTPSCWSYKALVIAHMSFQIC
jgi:hypothetical protein